MLFIRELTLLADKRKLTKIDRIHLKDRKGAEIHMTAPLSKGIKKKIFPMTNLTCLKLEVNDFFDEHLLIELTQELHNLSRLQMNIKMHTITTDLLKTMLKHAKQLQEFQIFLAPDTLLELDKTDYYDILSIVKSRKNNTKLIIRIECVPNILTGYHIKYVHLNMVRKNLDIILKYAQTEFVDRYEY